MYAHSGDAKAALDQYKILKAQGKGRPAELAEKLFSQIYQKQDPVADSDNFVDAETVPKAESQTSLEETTGWLTDKLDGLSSYASDGSRDRIEHLSFSRCNVDLTTSFEQGSVKILERYSPFLNLAEKASAEPNKYGNWMISLYFNRNIYQFKETHSGGRIQKDEEKMNRIVIFTADEDLAKRSAKAFNRLIKLCGGGAQKEPF